MADLKLLLKEAQNNAEKYDYMPSNSEIFRPKYAPNSVTDNGNDRLHDVYSSLSYQREPELYKLPLPAMLDQLDISFPDILDDINPYMFPDSPKKVPNFRYLNDSSMNLGSNSEAARYPTLHRQSPTNFDKFTFNTSLESYLYNENRQSLENARRSSVFEKEVTDGLERDHKVNENESELLDASHTNEEVTKSTGIESEHHTQLIPKDLGSDGIQSTDVFSTCEDLRYRKFNRSAPDQSSLTQHSS